MRTIRRDAAWSFDSALRMVELDDAAANGDVGRLLNDHHVVVATEHLLARRLEKLDPKDIVPFDLIVIDEAHHVHEDNSRYPQILNGIGHRARLGITATPYRSASDENEGLYAYFSPTPGAKPVVCEPVFRRTLKELADVEHGGKRVFAAAKVTTVETNFRVDLSAVRADRHLRGAAFKAKKRTDRIAAEFEVGRDAPAIFFAVDVEDANAITASLLARKVRAQAVHTGSVVEGTLFPKQTALTAMERRVAVEELARKGGDLDAIVSVDVFIEGVDIPGLQSVFIARPTNSPRVYMQMVGRVMRGPAAGGTATAHVFHIADHYVGAAHFHPLRYEEALQREADGPTRPRSSAEVAPPSKAPKSSTDLRDTVARILAEAGEPLTLRQTVYRVNAVCGHALGFEGKAFKKVLAALNELVGARKLRTEFDEDEVMYRWAK